MNFTSQELGIIAQALSVAPIQGKDGIQVGNLLNRVAQEFENVQAQEKAPKPVVEKPKIKK